MNTEQWSLIIGETLGGGREAVYQEVAVTTSRDRHFFGIPQ